MPRADLFLRTKLLNYPFNNFSKREMVVDDVIPNSFDLDSLCVHQDFEYSMPNIKTQIAVSYTHLTLPTILRV